MSGNTSNLRILFFGDITGRQGRTAVKSYVASLGSNKPDFIIANIENASHGFGLTKKNYNDLSSVVNCFTSGNHIWDKKDIYEYIRLFGSSVFSIINIHLETSYEKSSIN